MKLKEKIVLMQLLQMYQAEKAEENISQKKDKYGTVIPTKNLYTHARVISSKLALEIEQELKSIWEA